MDTQLAESMDAVALNRATSRKGFRQGSAGRSFLIPHSESSPERKRIEDFIATEYRKHFSAAVTQFMPTLAGLHAPDGSLRAAVGYRSAAREPLFLEIYTRAPIEELIRLQTGYAVPREEIVEVGSLACAGGRAAMEIVTSLVPALIEDGFSWVVFTGADTVRNVFRRLNLRPVSLCIANKAMLGRRQQEWGSYYDHNPIVMAGRLVDGIAVLEPAAAAQ